MRSPGDPARQTSEATPWARPRGPRLGPGLFLATAAVLVAFATWANSDLCGGRPFLFMDEMIAFDGVKRIVGADSSADFVWAVADGGDQRYGRIFYNVTALAAWLPYRVFGDPGLIMALRAVQVAAFLGAATVLCLTFLRSWSARTLALAGLAALPFTDYYLTQPKPEPVQLLCLALFLQRAVARRFAFGWHWIFLGLAFGAKISALPFCAIAGLAALLHANLHQVPRGATLRAALGAGLAFLAGWIVAVPTLALPTRAHLASYVSWTFLATGHGSDDRAIGLGDWIRESFSGAVVRAYIPAWIAALVAIGALAVLAVASRELWRSRRELRERFELLPPWILIALGVGSMLPILVTVKRLWGFYLVPGQVLTLVGLVALGESLRRSSARAIPAAGAGRFLPAGAAVLLVFASGVSANAARMEYARLAQRTSHPTFRRNLATYEAVRAALGAASAETRQPRDRPPWSVAFDPTLFVPDSQPGYTIATFPGPFVEWRRGYDALVLWRRTQLAYFLGEAPPPPPPRPNTRRSAPPSRRSRSMSVSNPPGTPPARINS